MLLCDFQKARELFVQLEEVSEIVKDLQDGIYSVFTAYKGGPWISLPEVIKDDLIRHYVKIKEDLQAQIDSL